MWIYSVYLVVYLRQFLYVTPMHSIMVVIHYMTEDLTYLS